MHGSNLFDLQVIRSDQSADEQDTKNAETPSENMQPEGWVNSGKKATST